MQNLALENSPLFCFPFSIFPSVALAGTGGFAVSRRNGGDRFYNPPVVRRYQQMVLQQQKFMQRQQEVLQEQQQQAQLQMAAVKLEPAFADVAEGGNPSENDDSSTALSGQTPPVNVTNLDRLMETVTPFIPSRNSSEINASGQGTQEANSLPFYYFEDMCESLTEWSLYGTGVPYLLNGQDLITQYYVPYLSGIQLYVDPSKPLSHLRKPGEENSLLNTCSSSNKAEISSSPGLLFFEYLEREKPWVRKPLSEKLEALASQIPDLRQCRSYDLLPASWISVSWYPIYRIPVGPILGDLDACFLTFHSLSTQSTSKFPPLFQAVNASKDRGIVDSSSKIPLPVFGLASYKLKGSILNPCEQHECEQERSLLQAAESWLQQLRVIHPDFQFFLSRYPRLR
ncbi:Protein of unknown function (DUF789) [Abeliophyllum distichum]|uniref:Uncharacterized protein n=1 Tax=Abeliophyllum distichum TaxID=126358 RepID=A0ABD1TCQ5_9LAMI